MSSPNSQARVSIKNHHNTWNEIELSQCLYFGLAKKPEYLEQNAARLGSEWIASQLIAGHRLFIYRTNSNGTWFVVNLDEQRGEVLNFQQYDDVKPDDAADGIVPFSTLAIRTRNYRALRNADWSPSGVCALVGPNGSGKTTLLTLLEFMRNSYLRSAPSAIDQIGGVHGLRSWAASGSDDVVVSVTVNDLKWQLQLATQGPTLSSKLGESVSFGDELLLNRSAHSQEVVHRGKSVTIAETDERAALRVVADSVSAHEFASLIAVLTNLRVYRSYNIWSLQTNGSRQGGDLYLHPSGQNVFTVLRNWRDRRDLRPSYQFVVNHLHKAFPEVFNDLDFHVAGMTVTADVIDPTSNEPCPLAIAPDGVITGLLHLTAAAGAVPGSLIAIDDFGNDLHPYAIRKIVEAFRELADEKQLTICLASHSPVLLDEFKDEPSSVWVMEHGLENRPVRLTDLFDEEWLSRFSLGRLYSHGEFGGQIKRTDAAR